MRRLTLSSPTFVTVAPRPAQDAELILPDERGIKVKRRYTIRQVRTTAASAGDGTSSDLVWDLDFVLHGQGIGARWGADADVGDEVELYGPRGRLQLREATWHLFVGDESAAPAIAALLETLGPAQPAIVLLEVADESEQLPITRAAGQMQLRWIHRNGQPPGQPSSLASALAELAPRSGVGSAYVLGESRAIVALRPQLARLGLTPDRTYLKGYWNVGRL